jgi:hypothetical protein
MAAPRREKDFGFMAGFFREKPLVDFNGAPAITAKRPD